MVSWIELIKIMTYIWVKFMVSQVLSLTLSSLGSVFVNQSKVSVSLPLFYR